MTRLSARHYKRPYRSPALILSTTWSWVRRTFENGFKSDVSQSIFGVTKRFIFLECAHPKPVYFWVISDTGRPRFTTVFGLSVTCFKLYPCDHVITGKIWNNLSGATVIAGDGTSCTWRVLGLSLAAYSMGYIKNSFAFESLTQGVTSLHFLTKFIQRTEDLRFHAPSDLRECCEPGLAFILRSHGSAVHERIRHNWTFCFHSLIKCQESHWAEKMKTECFLRGEGTCMLVNWYSSCF